MLVGGAQRREEGGIVSLSLWERDGPAIATDENVLAVNEALARLETLDPRAAQVVELRFFGGLSEAETAGILGISLATLKRDWDFAKAWLAAHLS